MFPIELYTDVSYLSSGSERFWQNLSWLGGRFFMVDIEAVSGGSLPKKWGKWGKWVTPKREKTLILPSESRLTHLTHFFEGGG
jgi:hypothetical protein